MRPEIGENSGRNCLTLYYYLDLNEGQRKYDIVIERYKLNCRIKGLIERLGGWLGFLPQVVFRTSAPNKVKQKIVMVCR